MSTGLAGWKKTEKKLHNIVHPLHMDDEEQRYKLL